jgi:8-oxo-dGTP pyrophosphatase MutT (NUDIX family)
VLGVDHGGLAYWVAAVRENFEEAGLLLGRRQDGSDLQGANLRDDRRALHAGECTFLDVVQRHGLVLDTAAVHYVAHWVTPLGSPRRFSARFFVTSPPPGQDVVHDQSETVGWAWMTPENALARFERDEIVMMTPTVRMLRCLAMLDSAAAVLEAASAGLPDERVRVKYEGGDRSKYTIVLPGEEGYDAADEERENGWIRLRPLAGLR